MSTQTPTPQTVEVETFVRVRVPKGLEPADFAVKLEQGVKYFLRYGGFGVGSFQENMVDNQDDCAMENWDELSDQEKARFNSLREEYVEKPSGG